MKWGGGGGGTFWGIKMYALKMLDEKISSEKRVIQFYGEVLPQELGVQKSAMKS